MVNMERCGPLCIVVAPLFALLSYILLHTRGMLLDPDGWAAWQGAVSLATGGGYRYFSGNPIVAWPPLYSAYLSLWTIILGPTGWSLLVANGVLIVLQAFGWIRLALIITVDSGLRLSSGTLLLLAVYLGLFVPLHQQELFAQDLVYCLLPAYLTVLWKLVSGTKLEHDTGAFSLLATLGAMLWLAHNTAIVFVVGASFMLAARRPRSWHSLSLAAATLTIPALCWLTVRLALGQTGSHHIGIGAGRYDALTYISQLLEGVGQLFLPPRFGAPFIAVLILLATVIILVRWREASGLRYGAVMTLYSTLGILLLFSSTWVTSPLTSSRQILFVVLILVPLAYVTAVPFHPRIAKAVMVVTLVPQLYWTALYVSHQQTDGRRSVVNSPTDALVPPNAYISRQYLVGPPVETSTGLLISPVAFEEPRNRQDE